MQFEIGIAPIQVVRAELFQVALQCLARVAVVLAYERQPVRRLQFEILLQLLVREQLVAHDVDLADARPVAFRDVDDHVHLVVGKFRHVHVDFGAILAAPEIEVGQREFHFLQNRRLDQAAFGNAVVEQRPVQVLGLDILVPLDQKRFDRGLFAHRDQQHVPVAPELDVGEEARPVQAPQELPHGGRVQRVADVHRQVIQHGALGDALQALDADVPDDKRLLLRLRRRRGKAEQEHCRRHGKRPPHRLSLRGGRIR